MSAAAEDETLLPQVLGGLPRLFPEIGEGHKLGSGGEPLPDDARGAFVIGWLIGALAEGFISRDEAERILRERSEPDVDQVRG